MSIPELLARFMPEPAEELPGGHCSRVFATHDRVLKVPFQGEELTSGFRASLRLSEHRGPQVFDADEVSGAILMERTWPGTKLADAPLSDSEKTAIFVQLRRRVEHLAAADMMPLAEFCPGGPAYEEPSFLHGDLHPENILLGPRGWVIIDPKGIAGDACFEAVAWLRNPIGRPERITHLAARLDQLHVECGWSPRRMLEWAIADQLADDPEPSYLKALENEGRCVPSDVRTVASRMSAQSSRRTFIPIAIAFLFWPFLLFFVLGSTLTREMSSQAYIFAAVPLAAIPMLFLLQRVKTQTAQTAALTALAVAELGVLMAMFMGGSRTGAIMAMAVAIPVMLMITFLTLSRMAN